MPDSAVREKYAQAAEIIARAGFVPFRVTDTMIEIVKHYLDESEAGFIIKNFNSGSTLSAEQIKEKSGLSDPELKSITDRLAKKGIIFNQPNTKGEIVYRLLPLIVVGTFEYTFMKELPEGDAIKDFEKVAKLYHLLLDELRDTIQNNYDNLLPFFKAQPPIDRTLPVFTNQAGKT